MRKFKLIAALMLALLVAVMVFQNWEQVVIHILFATIIMPQAVLLFISAALGFALGVLLTLLSRPKRSE